MLKNLCNLIKNDDVKINIKLKKVEYIRKLIKDKINERYRGRNALSWAIECGEDEVAEILERYGAFEDGISHEEQEELNDKLVAAVQQANYATVVKYIELGADVNAIGLDGTTALMEAIKKDRMKVVDLLLSEGCNIDQQNFDGLCAVAIACRKGNCEALDKLIKAGANLNLADEDGMTCLMDACDTANFECAKMLIENGAKVNQRDNAGNTELMYASVNSDTEAELIDLLVNNGAEIDAQNNEEKTALIRATEAGCYSNVESLLEHGADVVLMDANHNTAHNIAKRKRYKDIASLIEEYTQKNTSRIYGANKCEQRVTREIENKLIDILHF
jgi:serine/threonine-protein phosphatase 6 regulatory ankyrin repeat subunit B